MAIILIAMVLLRFAILAFPELRQWVEDIWQQLKNKFNQGKSSDLFDGYFVEMKAFYFRLFKSIPCITYIEGVDTLKIFELVKGNKYGTVKAIYQRNYYSWKEKKQVFVKTIFKLEGNILGCLGDDWVQILFPHTNEGYNKANQMIDDFKEFELPDKEQDYEINIISSTKDGLDLKTLEIKPTSLDINLYYNDDFKEVDAVIKERLAKENDKGIVLLHGLPGTGKTTYLRHLIGSMKKKVLFVSPAVASNLMNPEFMDLLIENPNSVLVIEDAENIIMDRKYSSHSSVSNLLNISDGLLSDCLNVQIICTFNSDIAFIDSALLRKGRLIAKYEFGKLSVDKARALSNALGLQQEIHKPMTLAEISNPGEMKSETKQVNIIGFRRTEEFIKN